MDKKVGRNQPCPCGSGNKYKRCCLRKDEAEGRATVCTPIAPPGFHFSTDNPLDRLSNSVRDFIDDRRYDEADQACAQLRSDYSEVLDGWWRQAMVYEARGDGRMAADYYRKAAKMAQQQGGFEGVQDWLDLADQLEKDLPADPIA